MNYDTIDFEVIKNLLIENEDLNSKMNDFEKELLDNPNKLTFMNNLLFKHQFSEEFLIKTIGYYDSWKCLKSQKNLSLKFCVMYLYDNKTDSADNWTSYNDLEQYFINKGFSKEKFKKAFDNILAK
jgi:hypothetical protein